MARYFEGTNTGNRYEVGKSYVTGDGRVLTAQPDGSFAKEGNFVGYTDAGKPIVDNAGRGAVSAGSRGAYDVNWYASGEDAAAYRAAGGYSPAAYAAQGGTVSPDGAVQVVGSVPATIANRGARRGSAAAAAFAGSYLNLTRDNNAWSGEELPPQDMVLGGWHLRANPKWSNGEVVEMLFGDNELVSTLYSVFHVPATFGYNARVMANENGWDDGRGASRAIERALQPDVVGDFLGNAVNGARSWAATNKQREDAAAAVYAAAMDAQDARDEYEKAEWDRMHTVVNPVQPVEPRLTPNVWGY